MDKEKLIAFLKFIGIESTDMQEQIRQTRFDLTSIILSMAAEKTGESEDTINDWYTQFSNMKQTDSNFLDAVRGFLTDKKPATRNK